jgi:hypothetical protein
MAMRTAGAMEVPVRTGGPGVAVGRRPVIVTPPLEQDPCAKAHDHDPDGSLGPRLEPRGQRRLERDQR